MDADLVVILLLAFLGSIAGLIGGIAFLLKKEWAEVLFKYAVPFAAGVLLSVSLLDLLPEAVETIGEKGYLLVLVAILVSFFFEQYFAHLHHHKHRKESRLESSVPFVIFGDTIHNFIDGAAIAASYLTNPSFGLVVASATFFHEIPHEIGDFGVLVTAGWSRIRVFSVNFISALATFSGALWVKFFLGDALESIGVLLAISAGVFLYLGLSDFIPEIVGGKQGRGAWKRFLFVFCGAGVVYLLGSVFPS